jgi:hypothetical protein
MEKTIMDMQPKKGKEDEKCATDEITPQSVVAVH